MQVVPSIATEMEMPRQLMKLFNRESTLECTSPSVGHPLESSSKISAGRYFQRYMDAKKYLEWVGKQDLVPL